MENAEIDATYRIASLAGDIRDIEQLRRIIGKAQPEYRQKVYKKIRPHLKFHAPTFQKLMRYA